MKQVIPSVTHGPLREETMLSSGLDYYKPTMSQLARELHPDTEVTFTFKNRGEQRLLDYIDPDAIRAQFETLQKHGFSQEEIDYLASQTRADGSPVFSADYLEYIQATPLPKINVTIEDDDIAIEATGAWATVTFCETIIMSRVNEAYFEGMIMAEGLDIMDFYDEGARRLGEKIALLQQNPGIKFSDFGTRRHFSLRWQQYVIERLKTECPDNFLGTSNVAFANTLDTKPIGTFAHEMPMVYAGLAAAGGKDIRTSHNSFLEDWYELYGNDLSIALTDTFGTDFFFDDFTPEQAKTWKALRQDSGDPIEFGEKAITYYEKHGIDPNTKTIVFSDGLDIDEILKLSTYFDGRINTTYGWGTTLTNDLGVKPLNIVMKATHVKAPGGQEADLVKLSDDAGKNTGPAELVEEYQKIFG